MYRYSTALGDSVESSHPHPPSCGGCPICNAKMAALMKFGQQGRHDLCAELYLADYNAMAAASESPDAYLDYADYHANAGRDDSVPEPPSLLDALLAKAAMPERSTSTPHHDVNSVPDPPDLAEALRNRHKE